MNRDPPSSIESLLKLAGERDQPSAAAVARARQAAHEQWQRALSQRPPAARRTFAFAAALVAILVALTAAFVWLRDAPPRPLVARVAAAQGDARVRDASVFLEVGLSVYKGQELRTGEGRLALSLPDGLSLRIDHDTRLRFDGLGRLTLFEGRVYVDSGGLVAKAPLRVNTPAGEVRHVGTQFQVQVQGVATRVQVREGRVLITPSSDTPLDLGLGDTADFFDDQVRVERGMATFGDAWEWATLTAPAFDIENRPLSEFLAWLAREHGWQLRFEDAGIQPYLREVRLHGSMEGLDHREMLQRAALITGIPMRVYDGILWVGQGNPR